MTRGRSQQNTSFENVRTVPEEWSLQNDNMHKVALTVIVSDNCAYYDCTGLWDYSLTGTESIPGAHPYIRMTSKADTKLEGMACQRERRQRAWLTENQNNRVEGKWAAWELVEVWQLLYLLPSAIHLQWVRHSAVACTTLEIRINKVVPFIPYLGWSFP